MHQEFSHAEEILLDRLERLTKGDSDDNHVKSSQDSSFLDTCIMNSRRLKSVMAFFRSPEENKANEDPMRGLHS
jgi:hypothetical protein